MSAFDAAAVAAFNKPITKNPSAEYLARIYEGNAVTYNKDGSKYTMQFLTLADEIVKLDTQPQTQEAKNIKWRAFKRLAFNITNHDLYPSDAKFTENAKKLLESLAMQLDARKPLNAQAQSVLDEIADAPEVCPRGIVDKMVGLQRKLNSPQSLTDLLLQFSQEKVEKIATDMQLSWHLDHLREDDLYYPHFHFLVAREAHELKRGSKPIEIEDVHLEALRVRPQDIAQVQLLIAEHINADNFKAYLERVYKDGLGLITDDKPYISQQDVISGLFQLHKMVLPDLYLDPDGDISPIYKPHEAADSVLKTTSPLIIDADGKVSVNTDFKKLLPENIDGQLTEQKLIKDALEFTPAAHDEHLRTNPDSIPGNLDFYAQLNAGKITQPLTVAQMGKLLQSEHGLYLLLHDEARFNYFVISGSLVSPVIQNIPMTFRPGSPKFIDFFIKELTAEQAHVLGSCESGIRAIHNIKQLARAIRPDFWTGADSYAATLVRIPSFGEPLYTPALAYLFSTETEPDLQVRYASNLLSCGIARAFFTERAGDAINDACVRLRATLTDDNPDKTSNILLIKHFISAPSVSFTTRKAIIKAFFDTDWELGINVIYSFMASRNARETFSRSIKHHLTPQFCAYITISPKYATLRTAQKIQLGFQQPRSVTVIQTATEKRRDKKRDRDDGGPGAGSSDKCARHLFF